MGGRRAIWADAIYINQKDSKEKSWQVGLMGCIYSNSYTTLIFLGEGGQESGITMDDLATTGEEAFNHGFSGHFIESRAYEQLVKTEIKTYKEGKATQHANHTPRRLLSRVTNDVRQGAKHVPISSIICVTNCLWFQRVWVLQELVLSANSTFMFGFKIITADYLMAALILHCCIKPIRQFLYESAFWSGILSPVPREFLVESDFDERIPALKLFSQRPTMSEVKNTLKLLSILLKEICSSGVHMQATDPRDFVLALMGLVNEEEWNNTPIKINYEQSCRQVYGELKVSAISPAADNGDMACLLDSCQHTNCLPPAFLEWGCFTTQGIKDNSEALSRLKMLAHAIVNTLKADTKERFASHKDRIFLWENLFRVLIMALKSARRLRRWRGRPIYYRNPENCAVLLHAIAMDQILLTTGAFTVDYSKMGNSIIHEVDVDALYERSSSNHNDARLKVLLSLAERISASSNLSLEVVEESKAYLDTLKHSLDNSLDYTDPSIAISNVSPALRVGISITHTVSMRHALFQYQDKFIGIGPNRIGDGDNGVRFQDRAPFFILRPIGGNLDQLNGETFITGLN